MKQQESVDDSESFPGQDQWRKGQQPDRDIHEPKKTRVSALAKEMPNHQGSSLACSTLNTMRMIGMVANIRVKPKQLAADIRSADPQRSQSHIVRVEQHRTRKVAQPERIGVILLHPVAS